MNTYFLIFGNHPQLSLVEFLSVLEKKRKKYKLLMFRGADFVFKSDISVEEFQEIFDSLGGSIKCGIVHKFCSLQKLDQHALNLFSDFFQDKNRCFFGISMYGVSEQAKRSWQKRLYKFGMSVKKHLQSQHDRVRFVTGKYIDLSSVIVKKNKLVSANGFELVVIQDQDSAYLGRTFLVQRFDLFGKRDYGRPNRDDKSGMLPPKLARIMLNLSQSSKDEVVGDVFCGSGTVLQEAITLGYQKIFGSDVSKKAMEDTYKNLLWLQKKYDFQFSQDVRVFLENKKSFIHLEHLPVQKLEQVVGKNFFDTITSEPYLGNPNVIRLPARVFQKEFDSLVALYQEMFRSFSKIVKKGGRVVVILPFFRRDQQARYVSDSIIPKDFSPVTYPDFVSTNTRGALEYARPSHGVGREIWVFEKK